MMSQVVGSSREHTRLIGLIDSCPRKMANLAQLDTLIIDTQNQSHEEIMDYGYV